MGRKTRLTIQMLLAGLFVMLVTVFLFTNQYSLSSGQDAAGEDVDVDVLADGTYNGTADGHNGPLSVAVTVANGEITDIEVLEHSETPGLSDPAFEDVVAAIIDTNSTDVDIVSGATVTSEAIMAAVANALSGEAGAPADTDTEEDAETEDEETDAETSDVTYEDGTFTGTSEGAQGPIELEVTVADGKITDIEILEHSETEGLADPAFEEVVAAIIDTNSTDVDIVSGATYTSNAIMAAVKNALGIETETADEDVTYIDGTYTGETEGHNGPLALEVTVEGGVITNVVITDHSETEGLTDPAFEQVPAAIIDNNSTNADTVSGATVTSNAIMEAVRNALEDAVE